MEDQILNRECESYESVSGGVGIGTFGHSWSTWNLPGLINPSVEAQYDCVLDRDVGRRNQSRAQRQETMSIVQQLWSSKTLGSHSAPHRWLASGSPRFLPRSSRCHETQARRYSSSETTFTESNSSDNATFSEHGRSLCQRKASRSIHARFGDWSRLLTRRCAENWDSRCSNLPKFQRRRVSSFRTPSRLYRPKESFRSLCRHQKWHAWHWWVFQAICMVGKWHFIDQKSLLGDN